MFYPNRVLLFTSLIGTVSGCIHFNVKILSADASLFPAKSFIFPLRHAECIPATGINIAFYISLSSITE